MTGFFKKSTFTIILATLLFTSCDYRRNQSKPDIWENMGFSTNTPIRNMYAGTTELLVMTDDEFLRIGNQNQLLERRVFPDLPLNFYGRPTLSRYAFARVVTQDYPNPNGPGTINVDQIEMHLTKDTDSSESISFNLSELGDNFEISIIPDSDARYSSAFNEDSDQFLLAALNTTDNLYSFFLFDVKINDLKTGFVGTGVDLNKRIDIQLTNNSIGDIMNVSHINGFYYVNTKWGTYRIDPVSGDYTEINKIWTLNTFEHEGNVFFTGFNDFDFYKSEDNGLTFEQVAVSPLKYVEVENGEIISQKQLGLPWSLADEDMQDIDELRVNESFEDDGAAYWNIKYFYGRYYLSIQKEIYYLDDDELETD